MFLCGSQGLICKRFQYVGCKFSICGKQLGRERPQYVICWALRCLMVATEVEDDNTIRSILHMFDDFGTDDAFALISMRQSRLTWVQSRRYSY